MNGAESRAELIDPLVAEPGWGGSRAAASGESFQFPARIDGVQELAQKKLAPLPRIRFGNSIADAVADLGKPEQIGQLFAGFQRFLYEPAR